LSLCLSCSTLSSKRLLVEVIQIFLRRGRARERDVVGIIDEEKTDVEETAS